MDFEWNPPAIREEKKKYANFTLREVSFRELEEWRAKERMKEEALQMKAAARDNRIKSFEAETGQKLDEPVLGKESWENKVAFAKSERKRLSAVEQAVVENPPWVPPVEPKMTFKEKVLVFLKNVWKSSGLSK